MISDTEKKILESCDAIFPRVLDFTKDMVKQYGVLNQEEGVLDVVERQMKDMDLPVHRVPIDVKRLGKHPLFAPVEWNYDKKYNLVSPLNPGAEG
ncbi:MAG: acetylornithine deacetylase, partial [Alphaproteobacteria bacterium]|nr:acetylornithine deacetylase [Alphaproteobacteria bacterium]